MSYWTLDGFAGIFIKRLPRERIALPPPGGGASYVKPPWRQVLKMDTYMGIAAGDQLLLAEAKYRTLARQLHPDKEQGDAQAMAELNVAIDDARKELRA